jgi:hypothetical protein
MDQWIFGLMDSADIGIWNVRVAGNRWRLALLGGAITNPFIHLSSNQVLRISVGWTVFIRGSRRSLQERK